MGTQHPDDLLHLLWPLLHHVRAAQHGGHRLQGERREEREREREREREKERERERMQHHIRALSVVCVAV